jgi:hypothetical protein
MRTKRVLLAVAVAWVAIMAVLLVVASFAEARDALTLSVGYAHDEDAARPQDRESHINNAFVIGGSQEIHTALVTLRRPTDPVYAGSEIGVDPYPVIPDHPTKLSIQVSNPTDRDQVVTATFSIAPFGIGLPFRATHIVPNPIRILVPARGAARGHVTWHPLAWRGQFCVRVTIELEGYGPIWTQRNVDVGGPLRPGRPHRLTFPVGAWPHTTSVTVALGLVNHMQGWNTSLSEDEVFVRPATPVNVTLIVTPPLNAELGSGEPIVDVEAYVEEALIGGFRKLDRPPVPLHKPHEKRYAATEIVIDPYPPEQGVPTRLGAVVHNTCTGTFTITGRFSWAQFGIGIPFTTTGIVPPETTVTIGPETMLTPTVTWTPQFSGKHCIRVELLDPQGVYKPQWSQRNVDVVKRPQCGQAQAFPFSVYNDSPATATVEIGMTTLNVPSNWEVTTVPSTTLDLGPYSKGEIKVQVRIPCASTLQQAAAAQQIARLQGQAGSVPTIDVEGYIKGELVGGIELRFESEEQRHLYLPIVTRQ